MFVNSMDSRLIDVLVKLNVKEFNKIEEIAEFMNLSTRTIQNYIKKLNEIMKDGIAEIINISNKGYKLKIYDIDKFRKLTSCVYENNINLKKFPILNTSEDRVLYIINFLIKNDEIIKIDDLADLMKIGRSTLTNDLKKVRSLLKMYNVKLIGKTNFGIKIVGDELNIRNVILNSSCKGFNENINLWNQYEDKYKVIKEKIISILEKNNFSTMDKNLTKILNYAFVMIVRVKKNKVVKAVEDKYNKITNTKEYNIALSIKKMLEKTLNMKLQKDETIFLTLPLVSCEASASLTNAIINDNIKKLVQKIIKEINYEFGILIDINDEITKHLAYHLNFMINRIIFNVNVENVLTEDIKRSYPLSFEMGRVVANLIEKDYHLKVKEDEMSYLALYFQSYIEKNKLTNYNIKKIALICGTGLGTAQLLKIKLKKLFNKNVIFDTFSDTELTIRNLNTYNMVFTTVNLNIKIESPIIKVNALFDENELKRDIQDGIIKNKYHKNPNKRSDNILELVMQPNMFMILDKNNYLDNLYEMLDKLLKINAIDEEFKNKILDRELKSDTLFGNYVALPHTVNKKSNNLSIAVGVLKNTIKYNSHKLKIIFMLIIPPESKIDTEILTRAYNELLNLCRNKKNIENLSEAKNYEEFKSNL